MKISKVCFLLAAAVSFSSFGSTQTKVDSWFNNMNYATVTNPGVYEGQSARYATMGGISTRAPITQPFNFVNVQTPKFSAGCGGIDLYTGGFSAIDSDAFINNLRAIGQNAQSLAFMLAIQVVSPQLSGVMEDVQTWADKYLNRNIDSCEAATALMGGAMDMMGADKSSCTIKRMADFGEDWTTANYACTTGGKRKQTKAAGDPNVADFIEGNLTWYVLMQDPFFSGDTEFAEVVLNLTGTVIITDTNNSEDSPKNTRVISPAISADASTERFKNIYKALLFGGDADDRLRIYRCSPMSASESGCKTMTNNLQTVVPNWTGLHKRVQQMVAAIVEKIHTDTPLTASERGLIDSTTIPLYRYLAATAATLPRGHNVAQLTDEYTALIAEDILLQHLQAVMERVEENAGNAKQAALSKTLLEYKERLNGAVEGLAKLREENELDIEDYFKMQERIQMYEKALMSKLGAKMVTSTMWGR